MRILYLNEVPPLPARAGVRQRAVHTINALRTLGTVDLAVIADGHYPEEDLAASRLTFGSLHVLAPEPGRTSAGLADRWRPWWTGAEALARVRARAADLVRSGRYDLLVVRLAWLGRLVDAPRLAPAILDVDDLDWMLHESMADASAWWSPRRRRSLRLARASRIGARAEILRYGRVLVTCRRDAEAIGHPATWIAPNVPMAPAGGWCDPAHQPNNGVVLTVGTWSWPPNADGLRWFLERCWPDLRRARPDIRLRVAGAPPSGRLGRLCASAPNVEMVGFVDDLRAEYAAAAVCVAPIRFGAGTKIKLLEALAHGRATVACT
ncbi:MAG: glycosyltransferase family 4 protein, partial [Phycisphaerae bacterium]|nr:glycosyltransferase family 4 protein [Phycisphaerae bacterium]